MSKHNKNISLISSFAVASILSFSFTGCGSSSSNNQSSANQSLSGNVADGYLVGAKVCLDKNTNAKCDDNEPYAITTTNGAYILNNLTNNEIENYPLLVEVDQDVIDQDDNQTVSEYYTLSARPSQTFISPISTMIYNYKISNNVTYAQASGEIQTQLGISNEELLTQDYIKSTDNEAFNVHKKAKIIANLKMQILTNMGNSANFAEAKVVSKYIDDKVMQQLSNIKNEVDINILDINTNIANIMANIDLSQISTELSVLTNTTINTQYLNTNFKIQTTNDGKILFDWASTTKNGFGYALLGVKNDNNAKEIAHGYSRATVECTKDTSGYRDGLHVFNCTQLDRGKYGKSKMYLEEGMDNLVFENGSAYASDTHNQKQLAILKVNSNGDVTISYK